MNWWYKFKKAREKNSVSKNDTIYELILIRLIYVKFPVIEFSQKLSLVSTLSNYLWIWAWVVAIAVAVIVLDVFEILKFLWNLK